MEKISGPGVRGGQNGRKGDETPSGMRLNKRKIFGGKCTKNFVSTEQK